jgi:hypothetical protein
MITFFRNWFDENKVPHLSIEGGVWAVLGIPILPYLEVDFWWTDKRTEGKQEGLHFWFRRG